MTCLSNPRSRKDPKSLKSETYTVAVVAPVPVVTVVITEVAEVALLNRESGKSVRFKLTKSACWGARNAYEVGTAVVLLADA